MRFDRFFCVRVLAVVGLSLLNMPLAQSFVHIGNGVASKWGDDPTIGTGATVTWSFVTDGTTVDSDFDGVGVVGGSNISQLRTLIDTNQGEGAFDAAIRRASDYDQDSDVDGNDFLLWQRDTNLGELSDWQANFGAGESPAQLTGIPEPQAVHLFSLGLLLKLYTRNFAKKSEIEN